jgi:hypothetical protein
MNKLAAVISAALLAAPSLASAQGIHVPPEQRALTRLLSQYNDREASAPNDIQRKKIEPEFRKAFCAKIPTGDVSGWIGSVNDIDDDAPNKGIRLMLEVSTNDLSSGAFGVELSLGNRYAYGVDEENTQPHSPTGIAVGSPLYDKVAMLRPGDTVVFSGAFIPYTSPEACYSNDTTYFALFRFSSIRKIGTNISF